MNKPSKAWPVWDKRFIECDCGTHGLNFLVSQDSDTPFKSLDISFWFYGRGNKMTLWERVKMCARILWDGKPHPDEITFHDESDQLPELIAFLRQHFERTVVSIPSVWTQSSSSDNLKFKTITASSSGATWKIYRPRKKKRARLAKRK